MTGYDGEEIIAGWLLSNGARLIIDVRHHQCFISNHVDFILVKDKAFMLECKMDENIATTNNFCFEVARCYLASSDDYHAWGFHSIADSMLIYSPQKHQIFEINSLTSFRKWLTPEQITFAQPVTSGLSHKGKPNVLSVSQPIPIEIPPAPFGKGGERVLRNGQKDCLVRLTPIPKVMSNGQKDCLVRLTPIPKVMSNGQEDNLWDKVTYNWLIKVDVIVKANLGNWHKMFKSVEQYKEIFKESLAVVTF